MEREPKISLEKKLPEKTKEEHKRFRTEETRQKFDAEKVKELFKKYKTTKIPKQEIGEREDKYHTYHKICGTDLILPEKKSFTNRDIYKALSQFKRYSKGVLYCQSCDKAFIYNIEH